jgi:membrane-bound lytic murein transglycosylase A
VPAQGAPTHSPGQVISQAKSRWVSAQFADLPGWGQDNLSQAWAAILAGCARAQGAWVRLCPQARALALADDAQRQAWIEAHFVPHRVEDFGGATQGVMTAYFEPVYAASAQAAPGFQTPLHKPPASLGARKPWFTREQMDNLPQARAELAGREIAYLADPIDLLILQIQGSGRLSVQQADGSVREVRVAFAGTNDQPFGSVSKHLTDRGEVQFASWPNIKAWAQRNPDRVQQALWANPRVVFFREEVLSAGDTLGPRGAQGVPLSAGRSVAVDPQSIPYGSLLWIDSTGTAQSSMPSVQRLVVAQDTGSAIVGAVRVDFFVGSGEQAGLQAGRIRQGLQKWVLVPR